MSGIYLELKQLAESVSAELSEEIKKTGAGIKIASIILGNDPASLSYLSGMKKRAARLGIDLDIISLDANTTENELIKQIDSLNADVNTTGIIVQVPLPKHIDFHNIAMAIDYRKDIDGINPMNEGLLFAGKPFIVPATAGAVILTLKYIVKNYSYDLNNKTACIVGRSLTVGKPLIHLALGLNLTPVVLHTKTPAPQNFSSGTDIVIAACGVPELINGGWIKNDSIVIDVGIHSRNDDSAKGYRLCGDVDRASVLEKSKILTAVPGGIGSITSVLIFANAVKSHYMITQNIDHVFSFEK